MSSGSPQQKWWETPTAPPPQTAAPKWWEEPPPAPKTPPADEHRSTMGDLVDVAKGYGKGGLKLAIDINGLIHPGTRESNVALKSNLQPTNLRQTQGMAGFDAASYLMPFAEGATAARGIRLIPQAAEAWLERSIPALTKGESRMVLARGAGRATPLNAQGLTAEAARTGSPRLTSAAQAMTNAASTTKPWNTLDTLDLVARTGGAGVLNPILGAAAGTAKVIARQPPGTFPQLLSTSAPAINAIGGGGAALTARILASLFGGNE